MSWYCGEHKVAENSEGLIKYLDVHGQLDLALVQFIKESWMKEAMAEQIILGDKSNTGCTREEAIREYTDEIANNEDRDGSIEFYLEPTNWNDPKPITYEWRE